jgi:hypothetical protein
MPSDVAFDDLRSSDLTLGTVYLGGTRGNAGDDPLARLADVGNQGGFRYKGSPIKKSVRLVVVYTSGLEEEWPDHLDDQTGILTYYGDNRRPGHKLLDTQRKGNLLLKNVFEAAHGTAADRLRVPPFVLVEKASPGRAVRFRGLLAPGVPAVAVNEDLEVIWKRAIGGRFENYRARFTVLNAERVSRTWLNEVSDGAASTSSPECPRSWREWVLGGSYDKLPQHRSKS